MLNQQQEAPEEPSQESGVAQINEFDPTKVSLPGVQTGANGSCEVRRVEWLL